MIRILHAIDTTGPGGAETVFVNLVKGLDRNKYEPTVVIRGQGWVCDELVRNGISPLFINSKGAINFNYLLALVKVIREKKIDLIQSHLFGSNLYCSLAGMICGVPVVSTFHGFVDINVKERFSSIKSWIINKGSIKLVFVSNLLKEYYVAQKGFSSIKSVTIYNGVDTSVFKPQRDDSIRKKLGLNQDNILVGAVGNIRPAKGYNYLLEAARLVIDQYPQFRFVVAGQGSGKLYDSLLELRKKLDMEKYFIFLGFEPNVARFLNNLDIFVLPSVSEGFSISTIEALACGIPVVVTKSGGPEEIVQDKVEGVLVEPENVNELSDVLLKFAKNSSLSHELTNYSNLQVENKYSDKAMLQKYCTLYSHICSVQ